LVSRFADERPTGFLLKIEIRKRLPGGVLHDEARIVVLLDDPRRRKAACGWHRAMIAPFPLCAESDAQPS
jgi:hypothetical protein